MRINNNIMAINTHRQYTINTNSVAKSTEKLSSGYRINRAGDDAAGLAISEKMRAQIRGLTMASKNSQDAISLVQTAEGALQETHNILQRMRELAVQSASDTNETTIDRDALNKEFKQLISEIDDTAAKTKFNDMGLIDGTYAQNIVSASSSTTAYQSTWAAPSVEAGTYNISYSAVEVTPAVTAATGTNSVTTPLSIAISSADGVLATDLALTFSATTTGSSDALNGDWSFKLGPGGIELKNAKTGETRNAALGTINVGANDYSFGDLGTLTITNSASSVVLASEVDAFGGKVNVTGSLTARDQVTKDVASLNGEAVTLSEGQSTMVFQNSGITVNLSSVYVKGTDVTGSIDVSKSSNNPFIVQTGANQGDELGISIDRMDAQTLGIRTASIANRLDASAAISQVNKATNIVSTQRAALGALQNRLQHKINNLDTSSENLQAAESRIRDLDMAKEMTNFTRNNILVQASTAMLAQANAAPQGVLQLLQ